MGPQLVRTRTPICVVLSHTGSDNYLNQDNEGNGSIHSTDLIMLKLKSVQKGLREVVQQ